MAGWASRFSSIYRVAYPLRTMLSMCRQVSASNSSCGVRNVICRGPITDCLPLRAAGLGVAMISSLFFRYNSRDRNHQWLVGHIRRRVALTRRRRPCLDERGTTRGSHSSQDKATVGRDRSGSAPVVVTGELIDLRVPVVHVDAPSGMLAGVRGAPLLERSRVGPLGWHARQLPLQTSAIRSPWPPAASRLAPNKNRVEPSGEGV